MIERVISLLKTNKLDFIVAYNQEYDDKIHKTTPFDTEAIKAAENNILNFLSLIKAFDTFWEKFNRMIVFAPDHGVHLDSMTGHGNHGLDIPEDMKVIHFFRFGKSLDFVK